MDDIFEIAVLSGKGGAGKTTITASLAKLFQSSVIVDADVDASDLHLLLHPELRETTDFYGANLAQIDQDVCTSCGMCNTICRFNAIKKNKGIWTILEYKCEGCGACQIKCPVQAISLKPQVSGQWFQSSLETGPMVHARLIPGAENSGKLVSQIKQQARIIAREQDKDIILVDGPPGIGCTVISALTGADLVILVAEPSLSSLHDIGRIHEVIRHFHIPAVMLLNKADMSPEISFKIEQFAAQAGIYILARIPLSREIMDLQLQQKTMMEGETALQENMKSIFEFISQIVNKSIQTV